jgi:hypothetical protein
VILAYQGNKVVGTVVSWEECPNGHDTIEGGPVQIDGTEAWQAVSCLTCNTTWTEIYRASSRLIES